MTTRSEVRWKQAGAVGGLLLTVGIVPRIVIRRTHGRALLRDHALEGPCSCSRRPRASHVSFARAPRLPPVPCARGSSSPSPRTLCGQWLLTDALPRVQ